MKRFIAVLVLWLMTGAWIYCITLHIHGLNSLQHITAYNGGLLSKRTVTAIGRSTVYNTAGNATVVVDTLGIPHIFGKDAAALAYAAGYMHAKDRYFQMELLAHSVMGRLSEIIGEDGIYVDENWKRFELEEKARQLWDQLAIVQPDLHSYLDAYAQGINAYVSQEPRAYRDPLYLVWNYEPQPWKPYYAFLIQWYMSFDLTFYDDYIGRQEILDKLPPDVRCLLYPSYPGQQLFIIPGKKQPAVSPEPVKSLVRVFQPGNENTYAGRPFNKSLGSNNWVIKNGQADAAQLFLCNDLHLFLAAPNIFYEMQLNGPGMHVYGYTIPGVPVVLTGHNEQIAWGITSGVWDVTEQYLLKTTPQYKDRYWLDGKWTAMTTKHFTIQVKGAAPRDLSVQYTVFGPVVQRDSISYALKWHPAEGAAAVQAFWKLMQATNWQDFRNALRQYDYPSQNFVYGDTKRNIGMICAGKMPVKPAGYTGGLLNGTVSPHWQYIPFDSLPQSYNPARNYLFSANQEPERSHYYYGCRWFEDLYRPQRINRLLADTTRKGIEEMRTMQLDVTDESVNDLKALLVKYAGNSPLSANWKLLLQWDGKLDPAKKEAAFYKAFRHAVAMDSKNMAKALGVKTPPSFEQSLHFLAAGDALSFNGEVMNPRDHFFSILHYTDSIYTARYAAAEANANNENGAYSFSIPQMTFLPGFDIPVNNLGGSENTINVNYNAHAVIRTVIELDSGQVRSWMVNATGQTGRFNDKKYLQQLNAWQQNRLHETRFATTPEKVTPVTQQIVFVKKNP